MICQGDLLNRSLCLSLSLTAMKVTAQGMRNEFKETR